MSLVQDSFSFFSHGHTPIVSSPWDFKNIVYQFIGVQDEMHISDSTKGRNLSCVLTFDGYSTQTLLEADINTLNDKAGKLTGNIVQTIAGSIRTFEDCTLLTAREIDHQRYDPAGSQWWQDIELRWRQRKRT